MKIKLVTFAPHPNYGTCLQSYALNKVLTKMGHDVEFIYNGRENPPVSLKKTVKILIKHLLPSTIVNLIKEHKVKNKIRNIDQKEQTLSILFLPNNYIHYFLSLLPFYQLLYKKCTCRTLQKKKVFAFAYEDGNYKMRRLFIKRHYTEVVKDADLFITGSDQIWNPYCGGFNPMMFLEFAGNKKRIAYASSIALPEFPVVLKERIKKDLLKFSHIGVREANSVPMLQNLLNRQDVIQVTDPTYLLSCEEWAKFGEKAVIEFDIPDKYIFCYFIGKTRTEDYQEMVENVKRKTGIQRVITMNCTTNNINVGQDIFYKDGGPYEFVYLLTHASYVCLDSFHGTVFSLKFSVDFVHILKYADNNQINSQNSRMYDMLNRYGILYKLYNKNNDEWMKPVNFEKVHSLMEREKLSSLHYLVNAINN